MSRLSRLLLVMLFLTSSAFAQAGGKINWSSDLTTAFAEAKQKQKILMVCVNAKYVTGRKTMEPASKGLREVVYKDTRVVYRSGEFVCALLTPASGSSEFGELRLLGIEGALVSPQHIFIHPDGKKILLRKEYWSHGKGDAAVKALLAMMKEAQAKLAGGDAIPDATAPETDDLVGDKSAPEGEKRPACIEDRLKEVVSGSKSSASKERKRAIEVLVRSDKDGDCTAPLLALLEEQKKNTELLVDLIRGLGFDKLVVAALPVSGFLGHKDKKVRGNAAVSLEYIGSHDPQVVAALRKAAGKEKDPDIANHLYRALGRCGAEDKKARSLLLKKCGSAKSEFASYGPSIGLAYFENDSKAARGVEKILKKIGVPGGRGSARNIVKRGVICWTLAQIGDKKSAKFMREQLIKKLENMQAFWVAGLKSYYKGVARACDGDGEAKAGVGEGVRGFVSYAKGANSEHYDREARSMMDEFRKGRDAGGYTPKGDFLLGG